MHARLRSAVTIATLAPALLAAGGCRLTRSDHCAVPETTLGTYELMRTDGDEGSICPPTLILLTIDTASTGVEQIQVEAVPLTFVVDQAPDWPESAAGALGVSETLAVKLDPSMDGVSVTFRVSGLVAGRAVAAGETTVLANAANIVDAIVTLETCAVLDATTCEGDALRYCDDAGFDVLDACAFGCSAARVECNACTPGADECHGSLAVRCGADGLPEYSESCWATPSNPNRRCEGGICVDL